LQKNFVFFTLKVDILQFVWSRILKFISHILILVRCKILWLDVLKKQFSIFFTLCYRNGSFECFLAKKGLGPLEVNMFFFHDRHNYWRFAMTTWQHHCGRWQSRCYNIITSRSASHCWSPVDTTMMLCSFRLCSVIVLILIVLLCSVHILNSFSVSCTLPEELWVFSNYAPLFLQLGCCPLNFLDAHMLRKFEFRIPHFIWKRIILSSIAWVASVWECNICFGPMRTCHVYSK